MTGRIRTIKPQAHVDEDLWDADIAYPDLHLFRAFTGLWCQADREGRFEWRPRELKAAILPHWNGDFSRVLDALATRGFLVKYAYDAREYGFIRTFKQHQFINGKEPASKLPAPPSETRGKTKPSRQRAGSDTGPTSADSARVLDASVTGDSHDDDAPIPSSSSSLPDPDPVPRGGAGGVGVGAPVSDPGPGEEPPRRRRRDPGNESGSRFPMHRDWKPNADSVAAVQVITLGKVTDAALQVFTGEFTGHFGQKPEDSCTDGEWNQRWQKWVQRGWNNPDKRPKSPAPPAATAPQDFSDPLSRRGLERKIQ